MNIDNNKYTLELFYNVVPYNVETWICLGPQTFSSKFIISERTSPEIMTIRYKKVVEIQSKPCRAPELFKYISNFFSLCVEH